MRSAWVKFCSAISTVSFSRSLSSLILSMVRLTRNRRQPDRRLVHQQDFRRQHQGAAERQHLLLAARHRAGELAPSLGKPREGLEQASRFVLDLGAGGRAERAERQFSSTVSFGNSRRPSGTSACRDRRSARW